MVSRDIVRRYSRRSRIAVTAFLLALSGLAVTVTPASAETGGYPYASLSGPGTSPAEYWWTDSNGNGWSPLGYGYRNCTDFVAWKLRAANGFTDTAGYGNAYQWGGRAAARGYVVNMTPAPGSVVWWNSNASGASGYGHVAWVESVSGDLVTIQEYNHSGAGVFGRRVINRTSASGYIHFRDIIPTLPPPPPVNRNLTFIKTAGTSGHVEIHWANEANNFSTWAGGVSTWFSTSDAANGVFSVYDMNGDAKKDLVFIKTRNTGSGKVELHWLDAAANFAGVPSSRATWFSTADSDNGTFMMGNLDGRPDLVFVKTRNTGGRVEIHYTSAADNHASWAGGTATWFSLSDVGNGTFSLHDMDGVAGDDLVFVKTGNTAGGNVELHWLSAASGFVEPPASYTTWYGTGNAANGRFVVDRLYGPNPGLVFLKTAGTTNGNVEVHFVSSADNYASWANGSGTWFSGANVPNGTFTIGAT